MKKLWGTLLSVFFAVLALGESANAVQQHYDLKPFTCPYGQFMYAFNPVTIGYPGWFCRQIYPPVGGLNGTFTCSSSVSVSGGVVTAATPQACGCMPKLLTDDSGTHLLTDDSGTHLLTDGGVNCLH